MSCKPYNPAAGLFFNSYTWGMGTLGQWSVRLVTANGQPPSAGNPANILQVLKSGSVMCSLTVRNPQTTRWILFPTGNYLAVRDMVTSGGTDDYRIWLFDLSGSPVTYRQVGGLWGVPTGKQLQLHPSVDGLAFFVFFADSMPNTTRQHVVYRSDTLAQLCSYPTILNDSGQRLAKITAARTVQILTSPGPGGGTVHKECPLPSGKCDIPSLLNFPDVVLDGPGEKTKTLEIAIRNTGADCLQIDGIAGQAPFSVVSPESFPVFIGPGGQVNCAVEFAPSSEGQFDRYLQVALTAADPASDTELHCAGRARNSLASCEVIGEGQTLQVVFGVNNTAVGNYGIKNAGGDLLKVESIGDGECFAVAEPAPDYDRLLGHNDQLPVKVEFRPVAVNTALEESLPVTCTPSKGRSQMRCRGSARLPNLGLYAISPETFTTYRFRRKTVTINVENTGEVELELSVNSTYPSYNCPDPGSVAPGETKPLSVEVWSSQLGDFPVPLTIRGVYHLQVNDRAGNAVIDRDLETECSVTIRGTVIPMPMDHLEPNDSYDSATRVDLPLPNTLESVGRAFAALTLDDQDDRNDVDFFAVSYQSRPGDDHCIGDSTSSLSLGMVMQIYAPIFEIETKTSESSDSESSIHWLVRVYKSDAYNREPVAGGCRHYLLKCPTRIFPDKRLYAVMSNPDYASQGPVEYNIYFRYTPMRPILRSTRGVTKVEYIKLRKYYEAIWRVDPPHDPLNNPLDAVAWAAGTPAIITDLGAFIDKHLEYISRADVLEPLQREIGRTADEILAGDCLSLAQAARAGGLPDRAERLYRKSAGYAARGRRFDRQGDALRGLLGLYVANGMRAEAAAVKKEIRALEVDTRPR